MSENDSVAKTEAHTRVFLPIHLLVPNEENPNEMSDAEFNMLCDNIEKMGITDPILVRPHPDKEGMYRIVGGHHRVEVAKLFGYKELPCTVIGDTEFTEDDERFQMVRHNIIHGKMNANKFMNLYKKLDKKHAADVAAELFGFADQDEFKRLVKETGDSLPVELKEKFKEGAKEVKTIDQLATLLNKIFSEHGDTLPYGYMIFDYDGKESVWLRLQKDQLKHMQTFATQCVVRQVTLDHVIAKLLELAQDLPELMEECFVSAPPVVMKPDVPLPTLDFLND